MKTTIGGERLGSGNKQEVSLKTYNRSTHDLSYVWRSSMGPGTLVPFMSELALPGDSWDIDLNCDVKTLPTIGPLFGSYKVQLDVFECPIRLYQGKLHMNMINIGMDMKEIKLPQMKMVGKFQPDKIEDEGDNMYINPSSIYAYLNIRGHGRTADGKLGNVTREYNAVPYLGYWEIYKQYYANLQEENATGENEGVVIHQNLKNNGYQQAKYIGQATANMYYQGLPQGNTQGNAITIANVTTGSGALSLTFNEDYKWPYGLPAEGEPNVNDIQIYVNGNLGYLTDYWQTVEVTGFTGAGGSTGGEYHFHVQASGYIGPEGSVQFYTDANQTIANTLATGDGEPRLTRFRLENIDQMREEILQNVANPNAVVIDYNTQAPYGLGLGSPNGSEEGDWEKAYSKNNQEGLGIKTYNSDLFNNWISTQWIDGAGGVGEVSAVKVALNQQGDDVIYMDSLNLQQKVYNMLNRIAVSGGTYDDWLDAVYTHERAKAVESPVYHGSLIKSVAFEEVISQADTEINSNVQPLGTLAGRGRLTDKHKGGKIKIKTNEPAYIMGIVSITPVNLDYSQGNKFDMNLKTMNDFYKPELGAIGYQSLVTGQMHWAGDIVDAQGNVEHESAGKQPAWINYMTNVNRSRGNFAVGTSETKVGQMFMTLNRRYEFDNKGITDLTTYIDPSKFNNIWAQGEIDAQNFWVSIGSKITARRKMSAKVIPNL